MAYCSNCGKKLPAGVKFCEYCGAPQLVSGSKTNQPLQAENSEADFNAYDFGAGTNGNAGMDAVFEEAFQEVVPPQKKRKKPVRKIVIGAIVFILAALFLLPSSSGWSEEDAKNATQAYLDYHFKGDDAGYAKYVDDVTEDELAKQRQTWRDDLFNNSFASDVPVSNLLKERYADFFMELRQKAEYTVGDAEKTDEGFEVPVAVKPIISFAKGEYTMLDVQLNDNLSEAELNERVYAGELERLVLLSENPNYGSPEEIVMHIVKGDAGYEFAEEDLQEIGKLYYIKDRHWMPTRAKNAVEAVLGGVYKEDYAGMAEWTVATQKELEDTLGNVFSAENMREAINELAAEMLKNSEIDEDYVVSDELAEKLSKANKDLLAGTKYEVLRVEGDEEDYVAKVKVTPFSLHDLGDELRRHLEAEMDTLEDADAFITRNYELLTEIVGEIIENRQYADPTLFDLHLQYNQNDSYALDYDELARLYMIYNEGEQAGISKKEDDGPGQAEEGQKAAEDGDDAGINEEKDNPDSSKPDKRTSEQPLEQDKQTSVQPDLTGQGFSSWKEIPVLLGGMQIDFGNTTLEDLLSGTGLSISKEDQGKIVEKGDLESVNLETGNDQIWLEVDIENYRGQEEKAVENCKVYSLMSGELEVIHAGDLLSVGGITLGDSKEDAIAKFGPPETEEDGYIVYSFGDYDFSIQFMFADDGKTIDSISVDSSLF